MMGFIKFALSRAAWPLNGMLAAYLGLMLVGLLLTGCTTSTTFVYKCPPLSPAPNSTLDALETQARKDPNTAAWVIDLDKHYQKCDIINKARSP